MSAIVTIEIGRGYIEPPFLRSNLAILIQSFRLIDVYFYHTLLIFNFWLRDDPWRFNHSFNPEDNNETIKSKVKIPFYASFTVAKRCTV